MVTERWLRRPDLSGRGALVVASGQLCDPGLRPRMRNPLLTAAVADLLPGGPAGVVTVASDAEVWVRSGGVWGQVWGQDMLVPSAREAWEAGSPAARARGELMVFQEELLDDPQVWAFPAVGFVPRPRLRSLVVGGVQELVVATDGAYLTSERCADLWGWLGGGLQIRSEGSPHPSAHGDVAVLHASFVGDPV